MKRLIGSKMNLICQKLIVLQFYVRYGGEFQLKQGFSPAFNVEQREDIEIGFEKSYNGLNVVVAEKDLWYFQDDEIKVDVVNHEDEISYSKSKTTRF